MNGWLVTWSGLPSFLPGDRETAPQTHWASDLPAIAKADAPGEMWAVDFQNRSTVGWTLVKIFSSGDEPTREALGERLGDSMSTNDFTNELDVLPIKRGSPRALRMDNGSEFISKALRYWALATLAKGVYRIFQRQTLGRKSQ